MPTFPEEAYPFLHKDEIMIDYLDKKATGQKLPSGLPIGELDVHPSKPWVLFEGHPQQKELCFFSRLEMIKETGTRARRAVGEDSVWTNQGKQEIPKGSKKPIGWKIHLTHHEGGKPTGYWMHEYRLAGDYEKGPTVDVLLCIRRRNKRRSEGLQQLNHDSLPSSAALPQGTEDNYFDRSLRQLGINIPEVLSEPMKKLKAIELKLKEDL